MTARIISISLTLSFWVTSLLHSQDANRYQEYIVEVSYKDEFKGKKLLDSVLFSPEFSYFPDAKKAEIYFLSSRVILKLYESRPKIFLALSDARKAAQLSEGVNFSLRTKALDLIASCFFYLGENYEDTVKRYQELAQSTHPFNTI